MIEIEEWEEKCSGCNMVLMRIKRNELDPNGAPYYDAAEIEIKCPNCGTINKFEI